MALVLSVSSASGQNGSLDPTFSFPYDTPTSDRTEVVALPDGKTLLLGSFFEDPEFISGLFRINSDGSIDESFNPPESANIMDRFLKVQPDGKILVHTETGITRLNEDGTVDETFDIGSGFDIVGFDPLDSPYGYPFVNDVAIQSDGKIIAVGFFDHFNGVDVSPCIVRLNSDGSLDNSFDMSPAIEICSDFECPGPIVHCLVQPNGRIVIAGPSLPVDGDLNILIGLNADGTHDDTFNTVSAFDVSVDLNVVEFTGLGALANSDILLLPPLMKFSSAGVFQTDFVENSDAEHLYFDFIQLSDGKILLMGASFEFEGDAQYGMVLINQDGSLDATFNPGTSSGSTVYSATQHNDGSIVITGGFDEYNGIPVTGAIRLNYTPETSCNVSLEVSPDPDIDDLLWVEVETESNGDNEYYWTFGDGNYSYDNYPTHTYAEDGEYQLCVTLHVSVGNEINCIDTYCTTVSDDLTSGIIENGEAVGIARSSGFSINVVESGTVSVSEHKTSLFNLYPNPSNGFLRIELGTFDKDAVLEFYDVNGKMTKSIDVSSSYSRSERAIDVSNFSPGMYTVTLRTESYFESQRFVRE